MKHSLNRLLGNFPRSAVMTATASNVADTTPPVLVSPPPPYIAPTANLVFTFSEPIKLGSGTLTLIANGQRTSFDIAGNPRMAVDGNTLSFDPPADLAPNTGYQVWISSGAILDLSGNLLVHPYVGDFEYALTESFTTSVATAPVNTTGTAENDTIHGSEFADRIAGGAGLDTLWGHGGDDIIDGGDEPPDTSGNIKYRWGDNMLGGAGNDILHGNGGQDTLNGDAGDDKLYGDADGDYLYGGAGNDLLDGGDGNDELSDDEGDNILLGGAGNDRLFSGAGTTGRQEGGEGNDLLRGYGGMDYFGGNGNDGINLILSGADATVSTIDGGAGDDLISFDFERPANARVDARGGGGVDTYLLSMGGMTADSKAQVRIVDFSAGPGGDQIDLRSLLGQDYASNPFHDGLLRLVTSGADTLLQLRAADAPGGYHTLLALAGVAAGSLTRENFVSGIDPSGQLGGLTLNGTELADLLTGTPFADTLRGNGGNDHLVGNDGDDTLEGGAGNDTLDGGAGSNRLTGDAGDDILNGGWDRDILSGGAGDDILNGDWERDILSGGAGNDILHGGDGIDRALYTGVRADYTFTRTQTGFTLTDKRGAAGDGADALADIERLAFADAHLALDINGAPGQVFRLYRAAFDREPDLVGQGFWMEMMDRGVLLGEVAAAFVASEEFTHLYGAAPTNAEIVTRLYQNILHREPEPAGYAFWLNILDTKAADLPAVLLAFSNGEENVANVAELIANGIPYTPYG